jgi:isopropylmalate/homocitrate/citramalate synthase
MPSIHFLDVTNRDGVQTARTGLSKFGKVMVNYYLGRLGVAQSEIGFPFLFHQVPYVRACLALGEAGRSGTCGCPAGAGRCPPTSRLPWP